MCDARNGTCDGRFVPVDTLAQRRAQKARADLHAIAYEESDGESER
jgi:hypothetical protein